MKQKKSKKRFVRTGNAQKRKNRAARNGLIATQRTASQIAMQYLSKKSRGDSR